MWRARTHAPKETRQQKERGVGQNLRKGRVSNIGGLGIIGGLGTVCQLC